MIVRTFLMSGRVATIATGMLLIALWGASLGCAFIACYDLFFSPPAPVAATAVVDLAHASPPLATPGFGADQQVRCSGSPSLRARRNGHAGCRPVDLLPV